MKKCLLCNREFTNNMDDVLASRRFTFVVDDTDPYCDSCDARKRAHSCVSTIHTNMANAREVSNNARIANPQAFLDKKLSEFKAYWVKWYTDFLDADGRNKYSYWLEVFLEYVDKNAQTMPDFKQKEDL